MGRALAPLLIHSLLWHSKGSGRWWGVESKQPTVMMDVGGELCSYAHISSSCGIKNSKGRKIKDVDLSECFRRTCVPVGHKREAGSCRDEGPPDDERL